MILTPYRPKKKYKVIKCKICGTKKYLPESRVCCSSKCTKKNARKIKY